MNDQDSNGNIVFPELFQEVFDDEAIASYFQDLEGCKEVQCRLKNASTHYAQDLIDLQACAADWSSGQVHSVQFTYQWEGALWLDTLSRVEGGTRMVRMKRDISDLTCGD